MPTSFCNRFRALMTFSGFPVIVKVTISATFMRDTLIFSTPLNFVIFSHMEVKSLALGVAN